VKRQLFATAVLALAFVGGGPAPAAAQASTALTGRVSSAEEGAMEGVVVSAKKAGSTVTVSVVSDDRGRFAFPSSKLGSGSYSLKIRATGYELDGPGSVEITLASPFLRRSSVPARIRSESGQRDTSSTARARWRSPSLSPSRST